MNNKYRGLYFLGATIVLGLLIIGIMRMMNQNNGMKTPEKNSATASKSNTHQVIEQKIEELTIQNIDPSLFNALLIEIENGASQGLFNGDMKNMLFNSLNQKYQSLALQKLNGYVDVDPINYAEVDKYLGHYKGVFGESGAIRELQGRIKTIQYYTVTLPQKVNAFIKAGFGNFEDTTYQNLMKELSNVPGNLRKRKFINSSVTKLQADLINYKAEFEEWEDSVNLNP